MTQTESAKRIERLERFLELVSRWWEEHKRAADEALLYAAVETPRPNPEVARLRSEINQAMHEAIVFVRDADARVLLSVPGLARDLDPFTGLFFVDYTDEVVPHLIDQVEVAIGFYRSRPGFLAPTGDAGRSRQRLSEVEERQANELRLLVAVHELSDGNVHAMIPFADAFERAGLPYEEGDRACRFMQHEKLFLGRPSHHVSITHAGLKEYRAAVASPGRSTGHFAPAVTNIFNGPNYGPVQSGNENTAHVQQRVGAAPAELAEALHQLRAEVERTVAPGHRAEANEIVAALTEESEKPKPALARVKSFASGLEAVAKAGSATSDLVSKWGPLIHRIVSLFAGLG